MTPHLADTPVLETKRFSLRAPRMEDYPAWEDFYASDRARFIGGPGDRYTAWRAFAHVVGMWALRGFGSFVFTPKGSDTALGLTGPWYPMSWPEPEIGWTLWSADQEGKGFAYEAGQAAAAFAFNKLGWETAVSYIAPDNNRSIALAERLGAKLDGTAERPHPEDLVYRHPKPEAA